MIALPVAMLAAPVRPACVSCGRPDVDQPLEQIATAEQALQNTLTLTTTRDFALGGNDEGG